MFVFVFVFVKGQRSTFCPIHVDLKHLVRHQMDSRLEARLEKRGMNCLLLMIEMCGLG